PSLIQIDSERAQYWLGVGAQPSDAVFNMLKITGDWQKFKGLPGAEGTLKTPESGADAETRVEQADKEAQKLKAAKSEADAKVKAEAAAAKAAEEAPAEEAATETAPSEDKAE
ncbi:MAG: 30S ribosomal protein S16, partial [Bifidobacterium crudilactis]|nr:30S ribosomal protein S16 [Bifidobacterium crudilactis]